MDLLEDGEQSALKSFRPAGQQTKIQRKSPLAQVSLPHLQAVALHGVAVKPSPVRRPPAPRGAGQPKLPLLLVQAAVPVTHCQSRGTVQSEQETAGRLPKPPAAETSNLAHARNALRACSSLVTAILASGGAVGGRRARKGQTFRQNGQ